MKWMKYTIIFLLIFVLVFNFMPTGNSASDVISGFKSQATSVNQVSSALVTSVGGPQYIIGPGFDGNEEDTQTLRDAIVQLNIDIALKYGNGYKADDVDNRKDGGNTGKIRYSTSATSDYSSFDAAYNSMQELEAGTRDYMYFSCHGSCFYTWGVFWQDGPYWTGWNDATWYVPASWSTDESTVVSKKYTDFDTMVAELKPGDIIWNSCDAAGCPYHTGDGGPPFRYAHSMIYLGDIEIEGHKITHAYRNTGGSKDFNQWVIKPLTSSTLQANHTYYVASLARCIEYYKSVGWAVNIDAGVDMSEVFDSDD